MGDAMREEYRLTSEDVRAIEAARRVVRHEEEHVFMRGIYFDVGVIAATDGRRLLRHPAAGLEGLTAPLLLGPWDEVPTLPAEAGSLVVEGDEVCLQFADGTVRLQRVAAKFPDYNRVVPTDDGDIIATAKAADLLSALEVIGASAQLPRTESKHARTEVRVAEELDRLSLVAAGGTDVEWAVSALVSAEVQAAKGAVRSVDLNGNYLRDAVAAVAAADTTRQAPVRLELRGDRAAAVKREDGEGTLVVVMPLAPESDGSQERRASA